MLGIKDPLLDIIAATENRPTEFIINTGTFEDVWVNLHVFFRPFFHTGTQLLETIYLFKKGVSL